MTPGTFLFDSDFKFHDGRKGEKIFVVLNDGLSGEYLAVKTTSRGHRYGLQHGCQVMDRFQNFFLVKGSCCLSENTWIQLDSFYEFHTSKLIESVMQGAIKRIGTLDHEHTEKLLICATHSDDISVFQGKMIQASLDNICGIKKADSVSDSESSLKGRGV
ncbi:MAG: hypothetical protein QM808_09905 [Steroidobacteraceae bacterium]